MRSLLINRQLAYFSVYMVHSFSSDAYNNLYKRVDRLSPVIGFCLDSDENQLLTHCLAPSLKALQYLDTKLLAPTLFSPNLLEASLKLIKLFFCWFGRLINIVQGTNKPLKKADCFRDWAEVQLTNRDWSGSENAKETAFSMIISEFSFWAEKCENSSGHNHQEAFIEMFLAIATRLKQHVYLSGLWASSVHRSR